MKIILKVQSDYLTAKALHEAEEKIEYVKTPSFINCYNPSPELKRIRSVNSGIAKAKEQKKAKFKEKQKKLWEFAIDVAVAIGRKKPEHIPSTDIQGIYRDLEQFALSVDPESIPTELKSRWN